MITISFIAVVNIPGDPLVGFLPENPTPEEYQRVAAEFGLDQPVIVQWFRYVTRTLKGDLGRSLRTGQLVVDDLIPAAAATLELATFAALITTVLGIPMGIITAIRRDTGIDHILSVLSIGGVSAPIFWTALVVQIIFYGQLGWLPAGGRIDFFLLLMEPFPRPTGLYLLDAAVAGRMDALGSAIIHMLMPAFVMAYMTLGLVVRITRSTMTEVLRSPYIQTARSLGIPDLRVVCLYAFKNALPPIMTVLGLAYGQLLQGSLLAEIVFSWPGLGRYTVQSIMRLDYPGVIGAAMLITSIYVVINLIVDLLYPVLTPRLRG